MTWFGVVESVSAPVLMKMRRPSTTKALKDALVDDDDLHVLLRKAGSAQDRLGIVAQQLLDFRVADDRRSPVLRERRKRRERQRCGGDKRRDAAKDGRERASLRDFRRRNGHDGLQRSPRIRGGSGRCRKPRPGIGRLTRRYMAGFGRRANSLMH